jgi:hypothetical protein
MNHFSLPQGIPAATVHPSTSGSARSTSYYSPEAMTVDTSQHTSQTHSPMPQWQRSSRLAVSNHSIPHSQVSLLYSVDTPWNWEIDFNWEVSRIQRSTWMGIAQKGFSRQRWSRGFHCSVHSDLNESLVSSFMTPSSDGMRIWWIHTGKNEVKCQVKMEYLVHNPSACL